MFVRWQQYRSQALNPHLRKHNDEHACLKAILVESVRVNGKPRQRHVAFLGSLEIDAITEAKSPLGSWYDDVMTTVRRQFWYDVTTLLERLSNRVDPEDRQRIADSIAKKVGGRLMTEAELKQFDREIEAMFELPPRAGYK